MPNPAETRTQVTDLYALLHLGQWARENAVDIALALAKTDRGHMARKVLRLAGVDLEKLKRELTASLQARSASDAAAPGREPACGSGRSGESGEWMRLAGHVETKVPASSNVGNLPDTPDPAPTLRDAGIDKRPRKPGGDE